MKPTRIEGHTRELAKDQPQYTPLCIRDERFDLEYPDGRKVPVPSMTAEFELTVDEAALLATGGRLRVRILGERWPPIALWVEPPPT